MSQKCARPRQRQNTPSRMLLRPFSRHSSSETQVSVPVFGRGHLRQKWVQRPLSSDASIFPKLAIPREECCETGRGRLGDRPCWVRCARARFRDTPRAKPPLLHLRTSCKCSFHEGSQINFSRHSPSGNTTFGHLTGAPGDARYGASRGDDRLMRCVFRLPTGPKVVVSREE